MKCKFDFIQQLSFAYVGLKFSEVSISVETNRVCVLMENPEKS